MPNILFKKTFKIKPSGFKVATEKSFSFHGTAVTPQLIQAVNAQVASIRCAGSAQMLVFVGDQQGHYAASMNHDFQKYHEEDAVVAVLDVMERFGYTFKFQYDSEAQSVKATGSSMTSKEIFIFHK